LSQSPTSLKTTEDPIKLCNLQLKKIDLTSVDHIVFSIHRSIPANHWAIATVDVNKRRITLHHPLSDFDYELCQEEAKLIKCYLYVNGIVKGHCNFFKGFNISIDTQHPKQDDNVSCGVLCLKFARKEILGTSLDDFNRAAITDDILNGLIKHEHRVHDKMSIEIDLPTRKLCELGSECTLRFLVKDNAFIKYTWRKETPEGDTVTL